MIKSDGYFQHGLVRASSETKLQPITTTHGCICPKNHRIQIQIIYLKKTKKAFNLPNVRKDRKVRYLSMNPQCITKLQRASVPCTLARGYEAAWGGSQISNVTKSYLENVVIRHRLDLVELRHFCMYPPF